MSDQSPPRAVANDNNRYVEPFTYHQTESINNGAQQQNITTINVPINTAPIESSSDTHRHTAVMSPVDMSVDPDTPLDTTDTDLSYYPHSTTVAAARRAVNTDTHSTPSTPIHIQSQHRISTPPVSTRDTRSQSMIPRSLLDRVRYHDSTTRSRSNSMSQRIRDTLSLDDSDEIALRQRMREGMARQELKLPMTQEYNTTLNNDTSVPTGTVPPTDTNTILPQPGINHDTTTSDKTNKLATDADLHDRSLAPYSYWQWIRPVEQPVSGSQICKWYCNLVVMSSAVVSWVACVTFFMGNLLEVYSGTTLESTIYWDHINITGLGSFFGAYTYNDPVLNWSVCYSTGIVIITTTSLAFPCLTAFIIIELLRFTGIEAPEKLVKIEFALYSIAAVLFVAGVCAYGGCVAQVNNQIKTLFGTSYTVGWPIYGYMIGASAFMIFGLIHAVLILRIRQYQSLYDLDSDVVDIESNDPKQVRARRLTLTAALPVHPDIVTTQNNAVR